MKISKALQLMDEDSLARSKNLTPEQTLQFLDDFRLLCAKALHKTTTSSSDHSNLIIKIE